MLAPAPEQGRPLTLSELHMQLSTQRKDENWALEMEQAMRQFLSQSIVSNEFEVLTVECRTTLCEILAFGNLPSSGERWNAVMADMAKQAWWSSFQGNATSSSDQNGRTTIVTILQRTQR